MLSGLTRLWRDKRGGSTIEIAFALPVFATLLLGSLEFGRLFFTWSTIQYATEQAGRFAMSKPAATADELSSHLRENLPGVVANGVTITVTPEVDNGVNYMVIVASVHFSFISIIPLDALDIEGRSRVPMVI